MKNAANRQSTSDLNEIEALQISRETKPRGEGLRELGGVNEP
jgi:hypothetical protein